MSVNIMIMKKIMALLFLILMMSGVASAEVAGDRVIKGIQAEGSCMVTGMSAEQAVLTALQRARMAAIEQAVGIKIASNTVVTDGRLAVDFIRTYSKGYIVKEQVEWLPSVQHQKDKSTPPTTEYRVRIIADVYKPEKKIKSLGLDATLNKKSFRHGEDAKITIRAGRPAHVAILNITAEDKVVMIFPNDYEKENRITPGSSIVFPGERSGTELEMQTLPGHQRDVEAFFVVAIEDGHEATLSRFSGYEPMSLQTFFSKYAEIADYADDEMLTYEVTGKE